MPAAKCICRELSSRLDRCAEYLGVRGLNRGVFAQYDGVHARRARRNRRSPTAREGIEKLEVWCRQFAHRGNSCSDEFQREAGDKIEPSVDGMISDSAVRRQQLRHNYGRGDIVKAQFRMHVVCEPGFQHQGGTRLHFFFIKFPFPQHISVPLRILGLQLGAFRSMMHHEVLHPCPSLPDTADQIGQINHFGEYRPRRLKSRAMQSM
jgi:hypothetical protein